MKISLFRKRAQGRPAKRAAALAGMVSVLLTLGACGSGAVAPTASISAPATAPSKPTGGAVSGSPTSSLAPSKPAASASAGVAATGVASGVHTLNVGYPSVVASLAPVWMADATKAFTSHGLSVNLKLVAAPAVTPALLNKEIDIFCVSAAPVLTADLNGGVDEVYIGAYQPGNTVSLIVAPSIKTNQDLRGKAVASDRPGTPTDFFTNLLLADAGMKPSDVKILPLGGADTAIAALTSGEAQAAAILPPDTFRMEAKGFHELNNLIGKPYLGIGFVVLRSRINELAPIIPGFLAAIRDGITAYNNQPELAKEVLGQQTKEPDLQIIQKTYDFFRSTVPFDSSLKPNLQGVQDMLQFLSGTIPAAKTAKPEQFVDLRFVS